MPLSCLDDLLISLCDRLVDGDPLRLLPVTEWFATKCKRLARILTERRAKARSNMIDTQLEEDGKVFRRHVNVLVVGLPGSGKSTTCRKIRLAHSDSPDLVAFRPAIRGNLIQCIQAIIQASEVSGVPIPLPLNDEVRPYRSIVNRPPRRVLDHRIASGEVTLHEELANTLCSLWTDQISSALVRHGLDSDLPDSPEYFITNAPRLLAPDYVPTGQDMLRMRTKTATGSGIDTTALRLGQLSISLHETGTANISLRKWLSVFESSTTIVFCVSLIDYDRVLITALATSTLQSCLEESINLFGAMVNSRWFLRTSVVLLLTKVDGLKAKLPKSPLGSWFPKYTGGDDVNKAAKYILWRFMMCNRARLSIYPHTTSLEDPNTARLLFVALKETILQNALKEAGIL
ncbi:putative G protein alpha subunit GNA-3 [Vararia minispora EC-137]|uniref:G protein alpha subunit GNA-3 n=1 Tax=Vararia minispora EC-137 TaxID=1314806 RepID=A0ACB8Q691_9AGAM|nr:putative G protein alpha subunit GNA-3 [Vararia minispora EC-137]